MKMKRLQVSNSEYMFNKNCNELVGGCAKFCDHVIWVGWVKDGRI